MNIILEFDSEEERLQILSAINGVLTSEVTPEQLDLINAQAEDNLLGRISAGFRQAYVAGVARTSAKNRLGGLNARDTIRGANDLIKAEARVKS